MSPVTHLRNKATGFDLGFGHVDHVGHQLYELAVLLLQLLRPPHLIYSQTNVFLVPAIERLLADSDLSTGLSDCTTACKLHFSLSELANDLLPRMEELLEV